MRRHLTIGAAVIGLAFASCGSDSDETPAPTGGEAPAPHLPPFELSAEFRDCMADEGIDIPDSGEVPSGVDPVEFNEALQACAEFLHG
jgi:hypothetical protein